MSVRSLVDDPGRLVPRTGDGLAVEHLDDGVDARAASRSAAAHLRATSASSPAAPEPRSTRTMTGRPSSAGRTICHSSVGSVTSGTPRSADSTSLAWKRVPCTAMRSLKRPPHSPRMAGLAARARLAQDGARLLEVVAQQPVVAVEGGDDEVAPLPVGDLLAGGGVDGLDHAPVLVDVRAGELAARARPRTRSTRPPPS